MRDIRIDFEKRTITMTRKFAAAASDPFTGEFETLQEVRKAYPDFRVQRHTIKKNPHKESYRGLTYDYMRNYITTHDADPASTLAELEEMILISKCHSLRYPTIKKWFLNKYDEVRLFGVDGAETVEMVSKALDFPDIA